MIKHALAPVIASTLLLGSAPPANADEVTLSNESGYLFIVGQRQQKIEGSVTQKGREGGIHVIDVAHQVVSPRDTATGAASGRRMHKPLMVTKEIDKSSPKLQAALGTNEVLTQVTLKFYTPTIKAAAGGGEKEHFTIKLTNANIAEISMKTEVIAGKECLVEQIAFTYQKIEWTWTDGNVTAGDDWQARN